MPNRILKESICASDTINKLNSNEENLFYRLLVNCDDYGYFDGRPSIILARCYPLKLYMITEYDIINLLAKLVEVGLIKVFIPDNNIPCVKVTTWEKHQQIRAKKRKYPELTNNCLQLQSSEIYTYQLYSEIICNHKISPANYSPRNPIQSNPIGIQSGVIPSTSTEEKIVDKTEECNATALPLAITSQKVHKAKNNGHNGKMSYGEFSNVLLTTEEYEKLSVRFPQDLKERIERLSGYMASRGKAYKSHYATILNWARSDNGGQNANNGGCATPITKAERNSPDELTEQEKRILASVGKS